MMRIFFLSSHFYSVLILGACVKILVFIELLLPIVIHIWMWDSSDLFSLSLLVMTQIFLSFQCALAVGCKQKLCMELTLDSFVSWVKGVGCKQCLRQSYIFLLYNCCSFDFPNLNHVLLQSILRFSSLRQLGTSELVGDFCFCDSEGHSHRRARFL